MGLVGPMGFQYRNGPGGFPGTQARNGESLMVN